MAAGGWGTTGPLTEAIFKEGFRFSFYQAVRLLEIIHAERRPVGEGAIPERETVHFAATVGMAFPAGDIQDVADCADLQRPPVMTVNVMGLAGAFGPLPAPYTELILERRRRKDTALQAFLDLFNHRLISLLYRVRKIYRVGFDFCSPEHTFAARALFSLMGMGTEGLRRRIPVDDRSLLVFAAMFGPQPRSMHGLETVLGHHFQVPVRGRPFLGRWLTVSLDEQTRLGRSGANRALGDGALLGGRVWDQQSKFEIVVGPLNHDQLPDFLPGRRAFTVLCELTRLYAGDELEFDVRLVVEGLDAPLCPLNRVSGPQLGWTSWLRCRTVPDRPPAAYQNVRLSPTVLAAQLTNHRSFG